MQYQKGIADLNPTYTSLNLQFITTHTLYPIGLLERTNSEKSSPNLQFTTKHYTSVYFLLLKNDYVLRTSFHSIHFK